MDNQEIWTWIEERKWGYRGELQWSFATDRSVRFRCLLARGLADHRPPVLRVEPHRCCHVVSSSRHTPGSARDALAATVLTFRAHDLEKRQHLFGHHVLKPLPPARTGMFGSGTALDITPEVVRQEREIHAKWSHRPAYAPVTIETEDVDDQPPSYEKSEIDSKRASAEAPASSSAVSGVGGPSSVASSVDAGLTQAAQRIPPALPPRKGKVEPHMPGGL